MISKLAFAGVSALALILTGCAGTGAAPSDTPLTLAQVVQDAVIACQGLCAVAPTAETIAKIVVASTGSTGAALSEQVATQAATAFCAGVAGKSSSVAGRRSTPRRRAAARTLGGGLMDYGTITIHGKTIALIGTPAR